MPCTHSSSSRRSKRCDAPSKPPAQTARARPDRASAATEAPPRRGRRPTGRRPPLRGDAALRAVALLVLLARPAPARVVAADLLVLVDPPLLDHGGQRL